MLLVMLRRDEEYPEYRDGRSAMVRPYLRSQILHTISTKVLCARHLSLKIKPIPCGVRP